MAQAQPANRNPNIEFIVKPKEDLFLEGALRRLPRVTKGDAYPCQMQKSQTFACLFRHYAKHNGLRKEDLIFTFTDELQSDQTPETVHLMPQDEIWVEHRTKIVEEVPMPVAPVLDTYTEQFRSLLESGNHADVTFKVGPGLEEIRAHRAILSARSQYFHNMLNNGMIESQHGVVRMPEQEVSVIKLMLEFLYTNQIRELDAVLPDIAIDLLAVANLYLLNDLRILCEQTVKNYITIDNVARLFGYSQNHNASVLRAACCDFTRDHNEQLYTSAKFQSELIQNPELAVLVMESNLPRGKRPSSLVEGGFLSSSSTGGAVVGGGLSGNEDSQDFGGAAGDHGTWFGAPAAPALTTTTAQQVNATMAAMMHNTLAQHEQHMHDLALQQPAGGGGGHNHLHAFFGNANTSRSAQPAPATATGLPPAAGSGNKRRRIADANSENEAEEAGAAATASQHTSHNNSSSSSSATSSAQNSPNAPSQALARGINGNNQRSHSRTVLFGLKIYKLLLL